MFTKISNFHNKLKSNKLGWRYLLGLFLWKSHLGRWITIKREGYLLHFFPTALSFTLWVDKNKRLTEEDLLKKYLRQGDIVIDVGANIGTITLASASVVGSSGNVFSFEPHPRTFRYLQKNVALNRFHNVNLYNLALGSEQGKVPFSNISSDDQNRVIEHGEIEVQLKRLDQIFTDQISHIELLKIDVEGFEYFVLQGLGKLIHLIQCIYFEVDELHYQRYNYHTPQLIDFLEQKGFHTYSINIEGKQLMELPKGFYAETRQNLISLQDIRFFLSRTHFNQKSNTAKSHSV